MKDSNDHDHSRATHSAGCDEKDCDFIAKVHAHDDDTAVMGLSQVLAHHNESKHGKETDAEKIVDAVREKMEVHD